MSPDSEIESINYAGNYNRECISSSSKDILILNFTKADNCTFKWSSTGRHLLALASTDMSQESYYGENNLYLLNANNGERWLLYNTNSL